VIALRRKNQVMNKNGISVLSATKKWDLYVIIPSPNGRLTDSYANIVGIRETTRRFNDGHI
jgi:hypothetical protein